jgi:hypothetical protein
MPVPFPDPTQPPIYWVPVSSPGVSGKSAKLTTHFHLVLRLRMVELYLHPIRLYGVVLN